MTKLFRWFFIISLIQISIISALPESWLKSGKGDERGEEGGWHGGDNPAVSLKNYLPCSLVSKISLRTNNKNRRIRFISSKFG